MKVEKGCLVGCMGMMAGVLLVFAGVAVLAVCFATAFNHGEDGDGEAGVTWPERDRQREKAWVSGNGSETDPKILRIRITGIISETHDDVFGSEKSSASAALEKIRAATRDKEIRGLYLVIDTPGGEVTLSDVIADALLRFKKSAKGRFILAEMGACCCSGGYYIAACADRILAHPTTITGSIGVIMATLNAAELAKKIGIESVVIATGANKSMLDPLKPVDEKHVGIFRKAVEADYERFLEVVSKGRKIPVEKIRPIADGRVFCAEEAKKLGLVDVIGYSEDSEAMLAEMAKSKKIRVIRYKDEFTWRDLFDDSFFSAKGMCRALLEMSGGNRTLKPAFIVEW